MNKRLRIFLWRIGFLPEEICPICGYNNFLHGHSLRPYCTECGLFVDDLPEEIKKIIGVKKCGI